MYAPPVSPSMKMEDSFDNKIQVQLTKEIEGYISKYYEDDFNLWNSIDKQ